MPKLIHYRAQQNTLNLALRQRGGHLQLGNPSATETFRRKCYEFMRLFELSLNGGESPYDELEIQMDKPNSILRFVIRPKVPDGVFINLDGEPVPVLDEVGSLSSVPIPEDQDILDLDESALDDILGDEDDITTFDD